MFVRGLLFIRGAHRIKTCLLPTAAQFVGASLVGALGMMTDAGNHKGLPYGHPTDQVDTASLPVLKLTLSFRL